MTAPAITLHYDEFPSDFLKNCPVPPLDHVGVQARMHEALDKAEQSRKIIAVVGEKGIGKSFRLKAALEWFDDLETKRKEKNDRYIKQVVRVFAGLRYMDYWDTLAEVLKKLDPQIPSRGRAGKMTPKALKESIVSFLEKKHVAVIVLDECEVVHDNVLYAFRDIVEESHRLADRNGGSTRGIGLLIVGSQAAERRLLEFVEYGHRLEQVIQLPLLTIEQATLALETWLPGVATLSAGTQTAWRNIVRLNVCHDRETTLGHVESVLKEYARRCDRARLIPENATSWAEVPLHLPLFAATANDIVPPKLTTARAKGPRAR